MGVHFGSICFGSLLIAAIETLHDMLHTIQKKGAFPSWALCCIDRALATVQSTFDYINKYGFVQVAVHDENFLQASKRAISFLKYKGLTSDQETTLAVTGFFLGSYVVYTLISPFPAMVTALLEPWESVYGADFVDKAATRANLDIESNGVSTLVQGAQSKTLLPLAQELEKLVALKEAGQLSEAEFTAAKDKLLGA